MGCDDVGGVAIAAETSMPDLLAVDEVEPCQGKPSDQSCLHYSCTD